jgi:hypothetical protein
LAGRRCFLTSPASDYVNGTVLVVDRGWMGRMSVLDRIDAAGVLAVAVLDEPAGAALGRGFSGDECPDESRRVAPLGHTGRSW